MHGPIAEIRIFTVGNDRQPEVAGILKRSAHELTVHYRPAIVTDSNCSGFFEFTKICQQLTLAAAADCSNGVYPYRRLPGSVDDEAGDGCAVINRSGVWHAGDGGEASGSGSLCA